MNELLVMLPDAVLFFALCFLVLLAAFSGSRRMLTVFGILTLLSYLWGVSYQENHKVLLQSLSTAHLQSLFSFDISALGMKRLAGYVALLIIVFFEAIALRRPSDEGKEGVLVIVFALLGASLMVGASHYLMSYLGLELLSLSLVVLIAWGLETPQLEAAVKYFILSSLASGILLFGVSLIYGATGHLNFVSSALVRYPFHQMYLIGQLFVVAGIAFKLGWVPFHFWLSDVYASARWYTVVALSSLSKVGVLGFLIRLFDADVFASVSAPWAVQLMLVLSVLSIFIGNILAVQQKNIRRLLAYSSIANMGFLGLAVISKTGAPFYLAIYILNTLPIAAVLYTHFGTSLAIHLSDLKGLGFKKPYQSALLVFSFLSLAGIPMTPGFWAKWHVFQAFFASYSPLFSVFIIIGTLVGTFYYLRLVKFLYEESSDVDDDSVLTETVKVLPVEGGMFSYAIFLSVLMLFFVYATIFPDRWLSWSDSVTGVSVPIALDANRVTPASPSTHLLKAPDVPIVTPVELLPRPFIYHGEATPQ
jgi:NADH-quinone oxidoreductase subunit N